MRGLVPRWGGGGAWQNPRCQFAVPGHNSSSSYLGVPAPAGMSDCYESMSRTPIRDGFQPPIRHLYVENASQMGPNCGVRVRVVSSVIGRAGQLHGGAGPE